MLNWLIGSIGLARFQELEGRARIHRVRLVRLDPDPVEQVRDGVVSRKIWNARREAVAERKGSPGLQVHLV